MKEEQLIENIIKEGESEQLELMEVVRRRDIAIALCSFLNNKGGRILVGVSDQGIVLGVPNASRQMEELKIYLLSSIIPETPITISIETVNNIEILLFKVYGGSRQPYLFDGNIYYRVNAKTVKATSEQISKLIHGRQKSEQHWERQLAPGVDLESLDNKLILSIIKESRENHRGNYQGEDIVDFLSYYGLFQDGSFTNACVVLFAKYPARYIPQIRVRLTEYAESKTDNALLRDEVYEDNLFTIKDKLERYINGLGVRSIFDKNQWKRSDFKFPVKALQEGVINALMHRDFSSPSSSVSISVYPDKIVISNSGRLPNELKVSDLKKSHKSHPSNPDIAHIVFLRGLIDKLGRGTIKLVEDCRAAGLKDPVWQNDSDGVTLTFNGPKALAVKKAKSINDALIDGVIDDMIDGVNDGVNNGVIQGINEEETSKVIKYVTYLIDENMPDGVNATTKRELIKIAIVLFDSEGIKAQELALKRSKSKPTMERYLKIARELGLIEFIGAPKSGGYFLAKGLKKRISSQK